MNTIHTAALHDLGVAELATALRQRRVCAVEGARHFLARAKARHDLGAYVALNEELTLAQARAADARIPAGSTAPLEGGPLAHKDIFVPRGLPSSAGEKMLAGYQSPFDATVVRQLAQAGAVTLGKLNCDEFAMGSSNENSAVAPWGHPGPAPVRNPWDRSRIPGGSSGGSAVAVAARLARPPPPRGRPPPPPRGPGGAGGGGGAPAPGAGRDGHRHRRLDPPAGIVLRHHRH